MSKLITIGSFSSRLEAEIVKSKLNSENIISIIMADDAGGMRPFPMSYVCGVNVMIDEKDFKKCIQILDMNPYSRTRN